MNLPNLYDKIFYDTLKSVQHSNFRVDEFLEAKPDTKLGLTLVFRPNSEVLRGINELITNLYAIAPGQYYYKSEQLHVTVLSLISCHEAFTPNQIDIDDYSKIISNVIKNKSKFDIQFKGLTASPSCIMIQGFCSDDSLDKIRGELRRRFKKSSLNHSIDKRYEIRTAHATITRFINEVREKTAFLKTLSKYRNSNFGTFQVNELEFVLNDWYHHFDKVRRVGKFQLS